MASKCAARGASGGAAMRCLVALMTLMLVRQSSCIASPAATQPAVAIPSSTRPPALILFGDSIVDSGNNNGLTTTVRANFAPYGQDFPGHNATGRFSNGKIVGDILGTYATHSRVSIHGCDTDAVWSLTGGRTFQPLGWA